VTIALSRPSKKRQCVWLVWKPSLQLFVLWHRGLAKFLKVPFSFFFSSLFSTPHLSFVLDESKVSESKIDSKTDSKSDSKTEEKTETKDKTLEKIPENSVTTTSMNPETPEYVILFEFPFSPFLSHLLLLGFAFFPLCRSTETEKKEHERRDSIDSDTASLVSNENKDHTDGILSTFPILSSHPSFFIVSTPFLFAVVPIQFATPSISSSNSVCKRFAFRLSVFSFPLLTRSVLFVIR
jgi:hypothetical protein